MKQKVLQIIHELSQKLLNEFSEHLAQQNAWQLLELATELSQTHLFAKKEIELTSEQQTNIDRWIHEIVYQHKPIQYILGTVPFLNLTIKVRPPILIPRPETEEWVGRLIDVLKLSFKHKTPLILDLCTGSGCIALALAKAFPSAYVYATDISEEALELAQENAKFNKITNVTFIKSDLYESIPQHLIFDLIVANPPYISEDAYRHLDPSVSKWEDKRALVASGNGLEIIEQIIEGAKKFLITSKKKSPQFSPQVDSSMSNMLWIEIGFDQAKQVLSLFKNAGFTALVSKDVAGRDRIISGKLI
jgi:release factor glutamine methyltransferase